MEPTELGFKPRLFPLCFSSPKLVVSLTVHKMKSHQFTIFCLQDVPYMTKSGAMLFPLELQ